MDGEGECQYCQHHDEESDQTSKDREVERKTSKHGFGSKDIEECKYFFEDVLGFI